MDTSGTDEKMKKNFDETLDVALATLTSLRKVIVTQRKKWKTIINPTEFQMGKYGQLIHDTNFLEYIAQLHKDSEVVEHMINRIEMDIETAKRNQTDSTTLPTITRIVVPSTNGKGK